MGASSSRVAVIGSDARVQRLPDEKEIHPFEVTDADPSHAVIATNDTTNGTTNKANEDASPRRYTTGHTNSNRNKHQQPPTASATTSMRTSNISATESASTDVSDHHSVSDQDAMIGNGFSPKNEAHNLRHDHLMVANQASDLSTATIEVNNRTATLAMASPATSAAAAPAHGAATTIITDGNGSALTNPFDILFAMCQSTATQTPAQLANRSMNASAASSNAIATPTGQPNVRSPSQSQTARQQATAHQHSLAVMHQPIPITNVRSDDNRGNETDSGTSSNSSANADFEASASVVVDYESETRRRSKLRARIASVAMVTSTLLSALSFTLLRRRRLFQRRRKNADITEDGLMRTHSVTKRTRMSRADMGSSSTTLDLYHSSDLDDLQAVTTAGPDINNAML
mmetsp:Transcript_21132/g.58789  ORF Transcript_21132/g.58789 Transcript_21132/m.58789 type:complete len:402 (-) Transcript_21132:188-1393(-)|eukprot:CAMPEP_0198113984 /NCGR_PEP_ID=MMETSP1442-20131203/5505_1 /TAXON_ID= /ORGANISM="Craspedostauros australis, Strain CCMP3328" /LENGTH=401 /DNA_ID=CAMNT_0043771195 /DNA_START=75 /DNA_END=1280 /DNA_ORIENTATION=-